VTPRLVFAHGWALDRTLWDPVLAALGPEAKDAVVLDAGYYGAPAGPGVLDPARPILGVGQSLGALVLLADPPAPIAGLVAIDGFARFAVADDFPEGESARALRFMVRRLQASAGDLIAEFLRRALGTSSPPRDRFDTPRLAQGLRQLAELDGRAAAQGLPIWRLHASGDPIASLALADASFAKARVVTRRVREGADHLSPITAPRASAELIRTALSALAT
jgi:pimeloyl-[acyl-carrier protein] methyl ester esterase